MSKFWTFSQNNSGGYFEEDDKDGICAYVIIEASSLDEVQIKADTLFSDYRNYCECCGERWSDGWMDEEDGTTVPEIGGVVLPAVTKGWYSDRAFVHYIDGSIKEVKFKEK